MNVFSPIWLPYCQMKTAPLPLNVVRTEGCRIILDDGRELIDGISSWWSMCHGYNHPHILTEVEKQLRTMPHVMLGSLVHEPAIRLAERLASIVPIENAKIFFSDSGSTAVEVALKMALQYWQLNDKPNKDRFICFHHGYHGDTLGAMSVSDPEHGMHKAFRNSVIKQFVMDIPRDEYGFAEFDETLAGIAPHVAGLIIEPLLQGAGGLKFHSADILAEIHRICKKHSILFIADEIATGFYRTGNMFACNEAGVVPDILCLGKALTGGTIGMGTTIANDKIFSAFLSDNREDAFMHGPTFMANPLACAAANASLDLFGLSLRAPAKQSSDNTSWIVASPSAPRNDDYVHTVEAIEAQLLSELSVCKTLPNVVDVRIKGAVGVVQLAPNVDVYSLRPRFVEQGVWIRPFNDVVYLMPPLIISPQELSTLTAAITKLL